MKRFLACLLAVTVLLVCIPAASVFAEGEPMAFTMERVDGSGEVAEGETFTVRVSLTNNGGFIFLTIPIAFDNSAVAFQSVTAVAGSDLEELVGSQLETDLNGGMIDIDAINEMSVYMFSPETWFDVIVEEDCTLTGALFDITFEVIDGSSGTTSVSIDTPENGLYAMTWDECYGDGVYVYDSGCDYSYADAAVTVSTKEAIVKGTQITASVADQKAYYLPGDTITVTYTLDGTPAAGIYGFEFPLVFDDAYLAFTSSTATSHTKLSSPGFRPISGEAGYRYSSNYTTDKAFTESSFVLGTVTFTVKDTVSDWKIASMLSVKDVSLFDSTAQEENFYPCTICGTVIMLNKDNSLDSLTVTPEYSENGSIVVTGTSVTDAGTVVSVKATPDAVHIMKPGTLVYTDAAGNSTKILNRVGTFDKAATTLDDGTAFEFILPTTPVILSAEYIDKATCAVYQDTIGTSVHGTAAQGYADADGIRFGTRMAFTGVDLKTATGFNKIKYNAQTYNLVEFGTLLCRKTAACVAGGTDGLTVDAGTTSGKDKVWKSVAYSAADDSGRTATEKLFLSDATGSYLEYIVRMQTTDPDKTAFNARTYCARGYMILRNTNIPDPKAAGAFVTVYADTVLEDSVNSVIARM